MPSMLSFQYNGPGYPNLANAGDSFLGGIKGLADMQAQARAGEESAASTRAASIRQDRLNELGRQQQLVADARENKKIDLESAKTYAEMRRTSLIEREAHLKLETMEQEMSLEAQREDYLRASPELQRLKQQLRSSDQWEQASAVIQLSEGELDKLPSGMQAQVSKLRDDFNTVMVVIPGHGEVPLPAAMAMESSPDQPTRLLALGARYRMTGALPGGDRISAADRYAAKQLNFSNDQLAALSEVEKIDGTLAQLDRLLESEDAPEGSEAAILAKQDELRLARAEHVGTLGQDRYDTYRVLVHGNGTSGLDATTRARILGESFPPLTDDLKLRLEQLSGFAPGSAEAREVATKIYSEAVATAQKASTLLQRDEADPAALSAVAAEMFLGNYAVVYGAGGRRAVLPQDLYSQGERSEASAVLQMLDMNKDAAHQARAEGRELEYKDSRYMMVEYIKGGDLNKLTQSVADTVTSMNRMSKLLAKAARDPNNTQFPPDVVRATERSLSRAKKDLVGNGYVVEKEDGTFELMHDVAMKALSEMDTARVVWRAAGLSKEYVPAGTPGAEAAQLILQSKVAPQLLESAFTGDPVRPVKMMPDGSRRFFGESAARTTFERALSTAIYGAGSEYNSQDMAVQGYQLDRIVDAAGELAAAQTSLGQAGAVAEAGVSGPATRAAKSLLNALDAFKTYKGARGLEREEQNVLASHFGLIAKKAGPEADAAVRQVQWVLSSKDPQAKSLRSELEGTLGESRLDELLTYFDLRVPAKKPAIPAAAPARKTSPAGSPASELVL